MLPGFLRGIFGGPMEMIQLNRDGDRILMLIHVSLEDSFIKWAKAHGWEYQNLDGRLPEEFTAYEVYGEKTCNELEERVSRKNPWFAFNTEDEYP